MSVQCISDQSQSSLLMVTYTPPQQLLDIYIFKCHQRHRWQVFRAKINCEAEDTISTQPQLNKLRNVCVCVCDRETTDKDVW